MKWNVQINGVKTGGAKPQVRLVEQKLQAEAQKSKDVSS